MRNLLFIGLLLMAFTGCEEDENIYEIDDGIIQDYLAKENIEATKHESGIYYIIEEEGDGINPTIYDNIVVNYRGYYVNNSTFDEGVKTDFQLSSLYPGWQYGLPLFKKGSKGKLFLPRHLANNKTVMIFDIELIHVWKP